MPSATSWKLSLLRNYGTSSLLDSQALPKPDRTPLDVTCGEILLSESAIRLDDPRDASGPSRLMAGPDARTRIAQSSLQIEFTPGVGTGGIVFPNSGFTQGQNPQAMLR